MDKQMILDGAVDQYHKLDSLLREKILETEQVSFLRGRMLELSKLIYMLDKQSLLRLVESPVDTESEMLNARNLIRVNLN